MSKEYLKALNKIQHDFGQLKGQELVSCYETIFNALHRLESIDNSNPSEALKDLERIGTDYFLGSKDCLVKKIYEKEYNTIKQALLKTQEKEKEKLLFKNIHNTKVKTPLVSIFEGLSKDERFKFIEHIYYHWEEMEEALEDKNNELEKENVELKAKAQKERKALEIIKGKLVDVSLIKKYDFVEDYNSAVWISGRPKLVKEEFNLLKEVLE